MPLASSGSTDPLPSLAGGGGAAPASAWTAATSLGANGANISSWQSVLPVANQTRSHEIHSTFLPLTSPPLRRRTLLASAPEPVESAANDHSGSVDSAI